MSAGSIIEGDLAPYVAAELEDALIAAETSDSSGNGLALLVRAARGVPLEAIFFVKSELQSKINEFAHWNHEITRLLASPLDMATTDLLPVKLWRGARVGEAAGSWWAPERTDAEFFASIRSQPWAKTSRNVKSLILPDGLGLDQLFRPAHRELMRNRLGLFQVDVDLDMARKAGLVAVVSLVPTHPLLGKRVRYEYVFARPEVLKASIQTVSLSSGSLSGTGLTRLDACEPYVETLAHERARWVQSVKRARQYAALCSGAEEGVMP